MRSSRAGIPASCWSATSPLKCGRPQDHATLLKQMGCQVIIVCETSNTVQGQKGTPLSARPVLENSRWAGIRRGV